MWILCLLCQGSFVLNFVVIRDIHFIIVFLLNDIIDILFYLSNTYVLYLSGIVRSNAGEWWREKKSIWWTSYNYLGHPFCNESHPKIQDSNRKLTPQTHFYSFPQPLFFSSIASIWSDDSRKVKGFFLSIYMDKKLFQFSCISIFQELSQISLNHLTYCAIVESTSTLVNQGII